MEEDYSSDGELRRSIEAAKTELGQKTAIFDKTMERYNKLQGKYESLLRAVEEKEGKRDVTTIDRREASELAEWGKVWQEVVSMALKVVPYKAVEPRSGAEQRQILVDVMKLMCDRVADPKESREYKHLAEKYKRNKKRMIKMKGQCAELLDEVQRNRNVIETHLKELKDGENRVLQEKVSQLERIVAERGTESDLSDLVRETNYDVFEFDDNTAAEELLICAKMARKAAQRYTTTPTPPSSKYKSLQASHRARK